MTVLDHLKSINAPQQLIDCIPHNCPSCGSKLEVINDIHLKCTNDDCPEKKSLKFYHAFKKLEIVGAAEAMIQNIYDAGFNDIWDVLDREKFTKENLIETELFKEGKTLNNMFSQIDNINSIPLETVIVMTGKKNLGRSASKQIAKQIAGIEYDFTSLERAVVEGYDINCDKRNEINEIVKRLNDNGINVIFPEDKSDQITNGTYELTGSPKSFGFKTKAEFIEAAKSKGYEHGKLNKDTSFLITDNLEGKSSKMTKANKLGVTIVTYSQFMEI